MNKKIFTFIALLLWLSAGLAQGKWELKKDDHGIQVYTRKAATGSLKELRVLCELDATKEQLISTLLDIPNYTKWVFSNKKSTIIKTINPLDIVYYTQTHLPWPLKDRDLVIELIINSTPEVLNVQAKSTPDFLSKNDNFIRVPYSLGLWKVTDAPNNKIKVDYTFSVDPGGSIPVWLVNAMMATGPYNSFVKLREVLKAKYGKIY
jgi:START domain-containing protein